MSIKDLETWVERDLARFARLEDHFQLIEIGSASADRFCFRMFTDQKQYMFLATRIGEHEQLSCTATKRKYRAGESFVHGEEIGHGDLSEDTWRKLLADILSYELVRVHVKADSPVMRAKSQRARVT